jgi:hypothetical protein
MDSKGNAYVTGFSFSAGTGYDFATIKYTHDLLANAGPDKEICSGQSVTLGGSPTAASGKPPYTYKWTPTTGLNDPTAPNPIATPATTTEYTVEVTDASGAKATDKIVVTVNLCAVAVFPAPNALNVNKAVDIAFTFANPIDPTTLTNSTIRVNGAQSGLHTSSNITYDGGTRKATFDPASDFKPGEVVNVTLTAGIKTTSGSTGAALTSPYTWRFVIQSGGSSVFTNVGNIGVGNSPVSTTRGDFDGDGDLDLAVANDNSGNVSILKNGLIAEAGLSTKICSGQSVTLGGNPTATNGTPPYTYKWTPTAGLDDPAAANPIAKPTTTTTYVVEVTDAQGRKATDQVTITFPAAGWSVAHIVDVDDVILGIKQGTTTGTKPRNNRGLALSPDERFLYLGYNAPSAKRLVRKIDLSVSDPAHNHNAVVAQLQLPPGTQPARAIATDDRGRVYLALRTKIEVYNSNLQFPPLHTISGFTACEGVATQRENGTLVVYATDRLDKTLERFALVEGEGVAIISSAKTGLDGDGEVRIIGAKSPRGLDIASDGTAWVADLSRGKVYRVNSAGSTVDSTRVRRAMDITIDETRGEVYVSQFTLRTLKVLNLRNGRVKRTLTPPAADLNVDLDGETGTGALCGIEVASSCQRGVCRQRKRPLDFNPVKRGFALQQC